jgi:hypothetical protein
MDIFAEGLNVLISTLYIGMRCWFPKSFCCVTQI